MSCVPAKLERQTSVVKLVCFERATYSDHCSPRMQSEYQKTGHSEDQLIKASDPPRQQQPWQQHRQRLPTESSARKTCKYLERADLTAPGHCFLLHIHTTASSKILQDDVRIEGKFCLKAVQYSLYKAILPCFLTLRCYGQHVEKAPL